MRGDAVPAYSLNDSVDCQQFMRRNGVTLMQRRSASVTDDAAGYGGLQLSLRDARPWMMPTGDCAMRQMYWLVELAEVVIIG